MNIDERIRVLLGYSSCHYFCIYYALTFFIEYEQTGTIAGSNNILSWLNFLAVRLQTSGQVKWKIFIKSDLDEYTSGRKPELKPEMITPRAQCAKSDKV